MIGADYKTPLTPKFVSTRIHLSTSKNTEENPFVPCASLAFPFQHMAQRSGKLIGKYARACIWSRCSWYFAICQISALAFCPGEPSYAHHHVPHNLCAKAASSRSQFRKKQTTLLPRRIENEECDCGNPAIKELSYIWPTIKIKTENHLSILAKKKLSETLAFRIHRNNIFTVNNSSSDTMVRKKKGERGSSQN